MFQNAKGVVSIWLGDNSSKRVFDKYFKETYGDDDSPLNAFARDAKAQFYDHDFVEGNWSGARPKPVRDLLSNHSYGTSFADAGAAKALEAGIEKATFVFVMYDVRLKPAAWPKPSPLRFIGTVPYEIPFDTPPQSEDDHQTPINETFITPDGRYAITTSRDGELRLWNLKTGRLIDSQLHPGRIQPDSNNWVNVPCATSGGKQILSFMSSSLALWQPKSNGLKLLRSIQSPHKAGISSAVMSADDKRLITSSFDKTLAVWNTRVAKPAILSGHGGRVQNLAVLPKETVLSQDDEGEFRLWKLGKGEAVRQFTLKDSTARHLCVTKNGKTAIASTFANSLLVIDLQAGKVVKDLFKWRSEQLDHALLTPDERLVVGASSGEAESSVRVWDFRSGKLLFEMAGHQGEITGLSVSHDGRLAVTVAGDANLIVWDLRKGKELTRFRDAPSGRTVPNSWNADGYWFNSVTLSPKGDVIVAGENSGRVRILRVEQNKLVQLR